MTIDIVNLPDLSGTSFNSIRLFLCLWLATRIPIDMIDPEAFGGFAVLIDRHDQSRQGHSKFKVRNYNKTSMTIYNQLKLKGYFATIFEKEKSTFKFNLELQQIL